MEILGRLCELDGTGSTQGLFVDFWGDDYEVLQCRNVWYSKMSTKISVTKSLQTFVFSDRKLMKLYRISTDVCKRPERVLLCAQGCWDSPALTSSRKWDSLFAAHYWFSSVLCLDACADLKFHHEKCRADIHYETHRYGTPHVNIALFQKLLILLFSLPEYDAWTIQSRACKVAPQWAWSSAYGVLGSNHQVVLVCKSTGLRWLLVYLHINTETFEAEAHLNFSDFRLSSGLSCRVVW